METKHFTLSKINWLGVITVTIGILSYLQTLQLTPQVLGAITITIGIANVILRTFFTNTTVTTKSSEFNG